jgi:transcriptional regulator with XRE-family HTH domain
VSLTGSCVMCDRPADPDEGLCPGCVALQAGNPIRAYVEAADCTLADVADAAGVSARTVMRGASGRRISGKAALKIARAIDCDVRELLVPEESDAEDEEEAG